MFDNKMVKGNKFLEQVFGSFQELIDKASEGIKLLEDHKQENLNEMAIIQEENTEIDQAVEKANKIKDNLMKMFE